MQKVALSKKIARIGGWVFLYVAFACAFAGWVSPEEEWRAWATTSVMLIAGGLAALLWGYRGEITFRLERE
ncbi:MAG: hypothetical protein AAB584_00980 [Patescibacteria group bacterium]